MTRRVGWRLTLGVTVLAALGIGAALVFSPAKNYSQPTRETADGSLIRLKSIRYGRVSELPVQEPWQQFLIKHTPTLYAHLPESLIRRRVWQSGTQEPDSDRRLSVDVLCLPATPASLASLELELCDEQGKSYGVGTVYKSMTASWLSFTVDGKTRTFKDPGVLTWEWENTQLKGDAIILRFTYVEISSDGRPQNRSGEFRVPNPTKTTGTKQ